MMKNRFCVAPVIAAAVIALAALTPVSCSDPVDHGGVWKRIERAVEITMAESGIPGAIVGVWSPLQGDRIIIKGKADIATGRDMAQGDRVRIASITKSFVVTIILELADEGYLDLGQTIDTWFSETEIPNAHAITVRELCNMTSGIFNYSDDETFRKIYTEDPNKVWVPCELVKLAVAHPSYFPPGTGWHYSNTNTIIIGMIIEKITGKTVEEEIKTRVIDRLNLTNTYYPQCTNIEGVHSRGYVGGEAEGEVIDVAEMFNPSGMGASGALISNLEDLKMWIIACAEGHLLSPSMQKERTLYADGEYEYAGERIRYGLGIMCAQGFLGHPGDGIGNTNAAFHSPENGTTVVILLNKAPNPQDVTALTLFMDIAQIMFPLEE